MTIEKKEIEKRNDGSYALDSQNKKMSVTTQTGEHSVLFEDIASTSYNVVKGEAELKLKNKTVLYIGLVAIFLGIVFAEEMGSLAGFLLIGGGIAIFMAYKKEEKEWEDVTVETRGGKRVKYSVDLGQGKVDMDAIEEARRR